MKNTILALGCALIAPVAFAQTSTSTTETTTTKPTSSSTTSETTTTKPVAASTSTETTSSTTTTSTDGTVTTFEPGKTIMVRRVGITDPISYTLGKTVQYVNRVGKTIEASLIRPGVPVHVYYDGTGSTQVVSRVVVDQD